MSNNIVEYKGVVDKFGTNRWTPTQILAAAWWDASDRTTVTHATQLASLVTDKTGNSRNVSQGNQLQRPGYTTSTINGLDVLEFYGGERLVGDPPTWLNGTPYFIIGVAQNVTYEDLNPFLAISGNAVQRAAQWGTIAAANQMAVEHLSAGSGIAAATVPAPPTTFNPYMYGCQYNSPGCELFRDGESVLVDPAAPDVDLAVTVDPLVIGDATPLSYEFIGYVGEIIILTGPVVPATRFLLEGYLAWKWGLQANLPNTHPYKKVAPHSGTLTPTIRYDSSTWNDSPLTVQYDPSSWNDSP